MPRTTQFKKMVHKAVQKSEKTSKVLSSQVKTQVKALLDKPGPARIRRVVNKLDLKLHAKRTTDKMDVDVVVHEVPPPKIEDVKSTPLEFNGHNWQRLPPVQVLLRDKDGDNRMKNPDLKDHEVVAEVKNITHDIFSLNLTIVELFGPSQDVSQAPPHNAPGAPLLPPGLISQRVPQPVQSPSPSPVDNLAALSLSPPVLKVPRSSAVKKKGAHLEHQGGSERAYQQMRSAYRFDPSKRPTSTPSQLGKAPVTRKKPGMSSPRNTVPSSPASTPTDSSLPDSESPQQSEPVLHDAIASLSIAPVAPPMLSVPKSMAEFVAPRPSVKSKKSSTLKHHGTAEHVFIKRSSFRFRPYVKSRRVRSEQKKKTKRTDDTGDRFEVNTEALPSYDPDLVVPTAEAPIPVVAQTLETLMDVYCDDKSSPAAKDAALGMWFELKQAKDKAEERKKRLDAIEQCTCPPKDKGKGRADGRVSMWSDEESEGPASPTPIRGNKAMLCTTESDKCLACTARRIKEIYESDL
ncbi:hypothetical protein BC629DRAFT_1090631 [Irpex lacteus]|nr:hypothetical protein BC629DRAFT_1090631 [Irpex lacteus]